MTYEERLRHRGLVERLTQLRERLQEGEDSSALTREEARELVAIVEETLVQISPERFDHIMETILDEATFRVGTLSLSK